MAAEGFAGEKGMAERAAAVLRAGIAPRDGIEETLAEQMAGCHEAALACLANARRQDLPESARSSELRTGARLMSLFTQQLGALERHRTHLRAEREAAESAEQDAALRRRFAEQDAEREAEEAVITPTRHARRLATRAALAGTPTGPTTDEAIFERLAQRFERRLSGATAEAEADGAVDPDIPADPAAAYAPRPATPEPVGAGVPAPPPEPAPPLNRRQRRALERLRRKELRADRGAGGAA